MVAWPRRLEFDLIRRIEISEPFWRAQGGRLLGACLLLPAHVLGQCPTAPQGGIVANPNRPTVADPADITELGVLELEYGWERDWRGGGQRGWGGPVREREFRHGALADARASAPNRFGIFR